VNQLGDACEGSPCETTIVFERVLPGTGLQATRVWFVYVEHREQEEQVYPTYHLRKAVVRHNIAAQPAYGEYLYEGLQPRLAFHLRSDEHTEWRTYFDGDSPIRFDVRPTGEGEGGRTVQDTGFSPEELEYAASVRAQAEQLRRLFDTVVGSADAEMGLNPVRR